MLKIWLLSISSCSCENDLFTFVFAISQINWHKQAWTLRVRCWTGESVKIEHLLSSFKGPYEYHTILPDIEPFKNTDVTGEMHSSTALHSWKQHIVATLTAGRSGIYVLVKAKQPTSIIGHDSIQKNYDKTGQSNDTGLRICWGHVITEVNLNLCSVRM
jgi:hypothetical protein